MRNPYRKGTIEYHTLRGQAYQHASASRELWRKHHAMSTQKLQRELYLHEYCMTDPHGVRGAHMVKVDTWYARMIRTELRRRGAPLVHWGREDGRHVAFISGQRMFVERYGRKFFVYGTRTENGSIQPARNLPEAKEAAEKWARANPAWSADN